MKRLLALVGILAFVAAIGCGQQEAGQSEEAAIHEAADQANAPVEEAGHGEVDATAASVTLTGTLGCGHCTYQKTDGCSAAMKTADGIVYILDGVDNHSEAYQKRMEGGDVKVVGVVADGDPPHVTVSSIDL